MSRLVIVTGSGRSGTSSVTGALKLLGCTIPQPEVDADEHNPRGYFEPRWTARFHGRWLKAIPIRDIDTRPHAGDLAMSTLDAEREESLRAWLGNELAAAPAGSAVVVKDPRAYWVYPLWARVAGDLGADLSSLTMLRHPAQVVRSRDVKHLAGLDRLRLQRETANVAAWVNSVVATERVTRDNPRAFVRYTDLLADWRAALAPAGSALRVDLGDLGRPGGPAAAAVDGFLTPSLNNAPDTWEGLHTPAALVDLAEATWTAAAALVVDAHDPAAIATLEEIGTQYDALYAASAAIASDDTAGQVAAVRITLQARLDRKNERIAALRARVRELEGP